MTTWLTPEWPINMMATTRVRTDPTLSGILQGQKTYDSVTSETPRPKPHLIFATEGVVRNNRFGNKGRDVTSEWHIVGVNKEQCNVVFNELMRLFDGQRLALEDHVMVQGNLTSSFGLDEEDLNGYRKICEYAVTALQA